MKRSAFLAFCFSVGLLACSLQAETFTLRVWPDGAPGAKSDPDYREETITDRGQRILKVTDPELIVSLPRPESATGAAVVICPGGAYMRLAIDHEGYDVAHWLNELGIAGVILKYRLPSDAIMADKSVGPLQDVQEAIRIVRRRAAEWRLDPSKIGVMGFSAGGHLASSASTHYAEKVYEPGDSTSARPDFSLLIYPVISFQQGTTHSGSRANLLGPDPDQAQVDRFSNDQQVNSQTPPAFLVHSSDDRTVPVANSLLYYQALVRNGVPAELHVYEVGGHGYGLAPGRATTESSWPRACETWLRARGLLEKAEKR